MLEIGRPVIVGRREVVLLPDEVGFEPQNPELMTDAGPVTGGVPDGARAFISESSIEEARKAFPEMPTYGFWQTLLGSGALDDLLDEGNRVLVYPYADRPGAGLYLHIDGDRVESGGYSGGMIPPLPGVRPDTLPSVAELDSRGLSLPSSPARLTREIAAEHQVVRRRAMIRIGIGAVLCVTGGIGADYWYGMQYQARESRINEVRSQIAQVKKEVRELQRTHLAGYPDQSAMISRVRDLARVTTFKTGVFKKGDKAITLHDKQIKVMIPEGAYVPDGYPVEHQPDGSVLLTLEDR